MRAEQQQVERPENNARRGGRHVRTGLDLAGLALTGQHSTALPPLCSDIAYRRRAPA